jgi:anti-anti-sigma factor
MAAGQSLLAAGEGPTTVTMPAEIDVMNADDVYEELFAALASGAPVVVADLTATTFCDSAGLRRLVMICRHGANRGIAIRLAVSPRGSVRRVLQVTGLDRMLPVYPTLAEAADPPDPPAGAG